MYNPLREHKTESSARTYAKVLGLTGAIAGGVAGIGLSAYVGWELGDHFKNLLELESVAGFGLKLITAVATTSIAGGVTGAIGAVAGGVTGGLVGAVTGAVKDGLGSLVSKLSSKKE